MTADELPSVAVVLATHNRPQLMRRALASILDQEYGGDIDVELVFDRTEPETELESSQPGRRVRVGKNQRSPGLAGARNTGILRAETALVAFLDDDDVWLPGKLATQVARLQEHPSASFVTTGMLVDFRGRLSERLVGKNQIVVEDLVRSRMAMLHSSSFVFRRASMIDGFGLVSEDVPRSMAEDWDLLMRAARSAPIQHVDEPLVKIEWGASSYFNDAWHDKNAAHLWMLEQHPEMESDAKAAAMMYGKLAFGHAAVGERRAAWRYLRRTLRTNWREPRAYVSLLALGGVPDAWLQETLNKRGHGV